MNCDALAPVPMTPTVLPVKSIAWSHCAEWNVGPSNAPSPAMSGSLGRLSCPTALITASASIVSSTPSGPRTCTRHRQWASS